MQAAGANEHILGAGLPIIERATAYPPQTRRDRIATKADIVQGEYAFHGENRATKACTATAEAATATAEATTAASS